MLLADASVPQTMFSPPSTVPQTMLSPSSADVPQTMFSPSPHERAPHDVLAAPSREAPQTVLTFQAFAARLEDAVPDLVVAPDDRLAPRAPRCGYALPGLRGREEARQVDGARRVQEARALRQRVVVR